jgi:hypothetical protein
MTPLQSLPIGQFLPAAMPVQNGDAGASPAPEQMRVSNPAWAVRSVPDEVFQTVRPAPVDTCPPPASGAAQGGFFGVIATLISQLDTAINGLLSGAGSTAAGDGTATPVATLGATGTAPTLGATVTVPETIWQPNAVADGSDQSSFGIA